MDTPNTDFRSGVGNWQGALGRLRDVVRQDVLARQLADLVAPGPLRVLDAGCGQGTQALRLARTGHQITGLDTSAELLAQFARSLAGEPAEVRARVRLIHGPIEQAPELVEHTFDLILCHGVLMYFADIQPVLAALSSVAADRATLSLLVRNGLAPAMRDGMRGGWTKALSSFKKTGLHEQPRARRSRAHTAIAGRPTGRARVVPNALVRRAGIHRPSR